MPEQPRLPEQPAAIAPPARRERPPLVRPARLPPFCGICSRRHAFTYRCPARED